MKYPKHKYVCYEPLKYADVKRPIPGNRSKPKSTNAQKRFMINLGLSSYVDNELTKDLASALIKCALDKIEIHNILNSKNKTQK